MRAIKITDLADLPINYTEFAGRVIFGGQVPSRFEPYKAYNSGDYVYIVKDGQLEVWRCKQSGTYVEISAMQWVKATIPNIVADMLSNIDINVPDADAYYNTTKCFNCRTIKTTLNEGETEIPVMLTNDMINNSNFIDLYMDDKYCDSKMYTISEETKKISILSKADRDSNVTIVYRDAISNVSGMVDTYDVVLTNVTDNIYAMPKINTYNGTIPDYRFYVNGVMLTSDSYIITSTDDIGGYSGDYSGDVIVINKFSIISGNSPDYNNEMVYIGKDILKSNNRVVCKVTASMSYNMDISSMCIRIPMNASNCHDINIYDALYYNEEDELTVISDIHGPFTQQEFVCNDSTIKLLNTDKNINNITSGNPSVEHISDYTGIHTDVNIAGPSSSNDYYFIGYNSSDLYKFDGYDETAGGFGNPVVVASDTGMDDSNSFLLMNNDVIYTVTDGEILSYNISTGVTSTVCDMGLSESDKAIQMCGAIVDNIIYIFLSGKSSIYKYDIINNITSMDDNSLEYPFVAMSGARNLEVVDDVIYGIGSMSGNHVSIVGVDAHDTSQQSRVVLDNDYSYCDNCRMCVLDHVLHIYIHSNNSDFISYTPSIDSYSINTNWISGITSSNSVAIIVAIPQCKQIACIDVNITDETPQCKCILKPCVLHDVRIDHRQYAYSELEYDGHYNKIGEVSIPIYQDLNYKSIGIPFSDIDENCNLLVFNNGSFVSRDSYTIDLDHYRLVCYKLLSNEVSMFVTTKTNNCTTIEYPVICTNPYRLTIPTVSYDDNMAIVSIFFEGKHIPSNLYTIDIDGNIVSDSPMFTKNATYTIILEQYNTLSIDAVKDIRYITASTNDQSVYELPFNYKSSTDMVLIYKADGSVVPPHMYILNDIDNTIEFIGLDSVNIGDTFDLYITRFLESPVTINELDTIREDL